MHELCLDFLYVKGGLYVLDGLGAGVEPLPDFEVVLLLAAAQAEVLHCWMEYLADGIIRYGMSNISNTRQWSYNSISAACNNN